MNPSHHHLPSNPAVKKPASQIQGPRPPPLSIRKDSHKIKKPPKPPLPPQQPIVIYAVSPKVINVAVADFMTTVQRLTGVSSEDFCDGGEVSPAARLASTEKVISPKEKGASEAIDEMVEEGLELGQIPGILTPDVLPPLIQERYFSPASDPYTYSGFLASPGSGLYTGSIGSPIFSPNLGQIWNF